MAFNCRYWLQRIYYLYETVNSFSGNRTGINYLKDVNVNWEMIFTDIKKNIENSSNREVTIDVYKQNLVNLHKELIASFTDKSYLLSLLQEISWSNSETPIPITLDINKKITDIIIKFDQDIFDNIKRGMREPFNVVNFNEINQMDNSTSLTNSVNSTGILLAKPEIKTAGLLEGTSTSQFWAGFGAGILLGAFTTVGMGLYCCFFNKHREVTAVRDLEANTGSVPLVNFPKKNKRIFKSYLAILTDEDVSWRPNSYNFSLWNHNIIIFNFFTKKLIDFKERVQDLFFHKNPFGVVIACHLDASETKGKPKARLEKKFSITRELYQKGLSKDAIITLFKMIDWSIILPKELELEYKAKIHKLEEEKKVSYITSIERLGIE